MFRITRDPSSGSLIESVDTGYVHVNGHDRTIPVILPRLPDDGSSVIRNMLEKF